MTRGRRGAGAGLALAAASVLYSRLGGRPRRGPSAASPEGPDARADEVERARRELAEELARRATRGER